MPNDTPESARPEGAGPDPDTPRSARIWNHLLGGTDNYPVDRAAAAGIREVYPGMADIARHSRAFTARVVRHLVAEAGVRQFLDVGAGLPAVEPTHETARRIAPQARVVYADNDPFVLAHARALLAGAPEERTRFLPADVRDTEGLLRGAAEVLDLTEPVGLLLMGVLGLVTDEEAETAVRELTAALPPGSHLALNDGSTTDPAYVTAIARFNAGSGAIPYTPRDPAHLARFFAGLDLLEPGVVRCPRWRPDPGGGAVPEVPVYGGVARKP